MPGDKLDLKVDGLIAKCLTIYEQLGGSTQETNPINEAFRDDPFLSKKADIMKILKQTRELINEKKDQPFANSLDRLKRDQEIRQCMKESKAVLKELQDLNYKENKKGKSKFSKKEMASRAEVVEALEDELRDLEEARKTGDGVPTAPTQKILNMEDHELFRQQREPGGGGGMNYEQETITDEQRARLQQVNQTNRDIDAVVNKIGETVDILHERAGQMGEKLEETNLELEQLADQLDGVESRLNGVNEKLSDTLKELDRGEGKCCMDILCLLLLLGLLAVCVQIARGG